MRKRGRSRKEQRLDNLMNVDEMAVRKPILSAAEHFHRKPYTILERKDKSENEHKK